MRGHRFSGHSGAAFARYHPGLWAVGGGGGLYLPYPHFLLRVCGDHLAAILFSPQYSQGGCGRKVYIDSFGCFHVGIPDWMQRGIRGVSGYGRIWYLGGYGGGLAV